MKYLIALLIVLTVVLGSCGKANSDSSRAQIIPSPVGYTCFVIISDGKGVGGNCVKD